MPTVSKIMPHSPIQEILPDVFFVQGSLKFSIGFRFSRNMVVLRQGDELTVINAVRLNDAEQARLDALGRVRHVMRIGTFHGMDDGYYVDRYGAAFWCQDGVGKYAEPAIDHTLDEGVSLPVEGLSVMPFTAAKQPECALYLNRHGGLLITCDAIQDWSDWGQCTWLAKRMMPRLGFESRVLVGPIWKKMLSIDDAQLKQNFEDLLALDFRHFVGAHGGYCLHNAKAEVAAAVEKAFTA